MRANNRVFIPLLTGIQNIFIIVINDSRLRFFSIFFLLLDGGQTSHSTLSTSEFENNKINKNM